MERIDKPRKWRMPGRPIKIDPAKNNVMVRFTDKEYAKFLTMYEESGVYAKAVFIKARVFNQSFRVIKTDAAAMEYVSRLTTLRSQFRSIGINYNQVVKMLHIHFSEKRALRLLYKLEKLTIELVAKGEEILKLTKEVESKWFEKFE